MAKPAVWTDAATGRKSFSTRAAVATDATTGRAIEGKGYSALTDSRLISLPEASQNATFSTEAKDEYRKFKEKRFGAADWLEMKGEFAKYETDHYTLPPIPRQELHDECEVLCIGAGFAGITLWKKLQEAGFDDVRFCEKGGDVGGTWYWNRYPGIACDVESYSYLPLLDDTGYMPKMKFASGFEILEYCMMLAERYGFYDRALFHTTVERTQWDESIGRWIVSTSRGDKMKARFVILANGLLTSPKLARIKGMEKLKAESFHTSRWNYNVDLRGKTVGIIGTGATAVQCIPELAKQVGQLYVFQRTPSSIDVRDQKETNPEEFLEWSQTPGWSGRRRQRFSKISAGRSALKANDDYLAGKVELFEKPRKTGGKKLSQQEINAKLLEANFKIMEQIRGRVDAIVEDPKTAAALKPYYPYGCKRPCFHDEYLPTFNLPHVHLVDTAPNGVAEINERGVVHDGKEYPVDVLIYATGFQWMGTGTFNMIEGRGGQTLREKWEPDGTKTFLGLHTAGFPNMVIIAGPQSGGGAGFNFTEFLESHVDYILWMLRTMKEKGLSVIDVKQDHEEAWAQHCFEADENTKEFRDCITYYNGDGKAKPGTLAYYGGQQWYRTLAKAQQSFDPYIFESRTPEGQLPSRL